MKFESGWTSWEIEHFGGANEEKDWKILSGKNVWKFSQRSVEPLIEEVGDLTSLLISENRVLGLHFALLMTAES